jgi:hypothetical protein
VWDVPHSSVTRNTNFESHHHNQILPRSNLDRGHLHQQSGICMYIKPGCTPDLEPWKASKAQSDIFKVYFQLLHPSFRTKDVYYLGLIDTHPRCCIRAASISRFKWFNGPMATLRKVLLLPEQHRPDRLGILQPQRPQANAKSVQETRNGQVNLHGSGPTTPW